MEQQGVEYQYVVQIVIQNAILYIVHLETQHVKINEQE